MTMRVGVFPHTDDDGKPTGKQSVVVDIERADGSGIYQLITAPEARTMAEFLVKWANEIDPLAVN